MSENVQEQRLITVHAVVYYLEEKEWKQKGDGFSRISIYHNPATVKYRIVAMSVKSNEAVINSYIFPGIIYSQVKDTFYQWADRRYRYGVKFANAADAQTFGSKFSDVLQSISSSAPPAATPPIPTPSPTKPQPIRSFPPTPSASSKPSPPPSPKNPTPPSTSPRPANPLLSSTGPEGTQKPSQPTFRPRATADQNPGVELNPQRPPNQPTFRARAPAPDPTRTMRKVNSEIGMKPPPIIPNKSTKPDSGLSSTPPRDKSFLSASQPGETVPLRTSGRAANLTNSSNGPLELPSFESDQIKLIANEPISDAERTAFGVLDILVSRKDEIFDTGKPKTKKMQRGVRRLIRFLLGSDRLKKENIFKVVVPFTEAVEAVLLSVEQGHKVPSDLDAYVAGELLKRALERLPRKPLNLNNFEPAKSFNELKSESEQLGWLKSVLASLPDEERQTVGSLVNLLNVGLQNSADNKLSREDLLQCFACSVVDPRWLDHKKPPTVKLNKPIVL